MKRDRKTIRRRVHHRIRKKVSGTPDRPRLAVHLSNKHVYAQVIDDLGGKTIAAVCTTEKAVDSASSVNLDIATKVGKLVAERCKEKGVDTVIFDRGGHRFHGRIKALADAAREGGLQF
ncbi:MAG: 50S ribosomal protein L18 [Verrucomicrobiales bacterium]